jgi:hypothetical protein
MRSPISPPPAKKSKCFELEPRSLAMNIRRFSIILQPYYHARQALSQASGGAGTGAAPRAVAY